MLLGAWRNFDHLEEMLSMHELIEIVKSIRDREWKRHKAAAALKGIDLDEGSEEKDENDPVEAAKRRVALRRAEEAGISAEEFEAMEADNELRAMGLKVTKLNGAK